jgi:hypothetical protein
VDEKFLALSVQGSYSYDIKAKQQCYCARLLRSTRYLRSHQQWK